MKGLNFQSEGSIGNEDGRSNLHSGGKLWIRASDASVVTKEGVVGHDLKILSSGKLDWLGVLQHTSSDFRTLGVEQNSACLVRSLLEGLSKVIKRLSMGLVVTVGEVASGNVHSSVQHFNEHINIPACRAKNRDLD
jgi:hypothetical protein